MVLTLHVPQEILVVRDDNELKVGLLFPDADDLRERLRQSANIVAIEVGRRLVQRDEAAIDAKALREREADDDASEHLLACTATPSHVHFRVLLDHTDTVVVRAIAFAGLIVGSDEDGVYVCSLVCLLP